MKLNKSKRTALALLLAIVIFVLYPFLVLRTVPSDLPPQMASAAIYPHRKEKQPKVMQQQSLSALNKTHPRNKCNAVYFWGGGKSGSTTLAALLKHGLNGSAWDPNGQFIDMEKELCWTINGHANSKRKWKNKVCNGSNMFALDACPAYESAHEAKKILEFDPDAKFLFLVRDPIDRLVSHLNDDIRRGGAKYDNMDETVKRLINSGGNRSSLSKYGKLLQTLLGVTKDPSYVLVVQTDAMKRHPQQVMDAVHDFIGGKRKKVQMLQQNKGRGLEGYKHITNETREHLQAVLREDVEMLERLVGRRFPWSWTNASRTKIDGVDEGEWLTAVPRS